jgi:hypothetical protein
MNCDQFRQRLNAFGAVESSAEILAHLESCSDCAALFQQRRRLEAGLKQIATTQGGWSAPPRVEAALLEEFRAQSRSQVVPAIPRAPRPLWIRHRLSALAAAGALAAALALLLISPLRHPAHIAAGSAALSQVVEADDDSASDNGFVPLPYFASAGEIANASEDDVVRVEMPRSALVNLGVPVNDDANSGTVEAELLLGEGGVPQAVRVLE